MKGETAAWDIGWCYGDLAARGNGRRSSPLPSSQREGQGEEHLLAG